MVESKSDAARSWGFPPLAIASRQRNVSICQNLDCIRPWPGLTTLIQVQSERQVFTHNVIEVTTQTRY
ncbi:MULTISPECIES: hypothetical protein [Moorena]|uniref:Uncharacterized protein n=1 Tax=Moorena bouillonii PNG TaxID=568701 RepID=A0A1U7N7Z1_9CYAN|nr:MULTISPECIES: hypothetical protein [Moorena]NEP26683.1 hypothetical protein [Moorena sp. SIO3I6]OLT62070.1 hypothetical protein BJP37_26620 [Moorena bouillonii PNG]